jgi:hypothetical protein
VRLLPSPGPACLPACSTFLPASPLPDGKDADEDVADQQQARRGGLTGAARARSAPRQDGAKRRSLGQLPTGSDTSSSSSSSPQWRCCGAAAQRGPRRPQRAERGGKRAAPWAGRGAALAHGVQAADARGSHPHVCKPQGKGGSACCCSSRAPSPAPALLAALLRLSLFPALRNSHANRPACAWRPVCLCPFVCRMAASSV